MKKAYIVRAEHPFQGGDRIYAFADPLRAEDRAAEVVNDILDDFWEIFDEDHTQGPKPVADRMNWEALVDELGYVENFVQEDRWGAWEVAVTPLVIET